MTRRLDSIYHYVWCSDGKERVFHTYKTGQNPESGLTRGFIRVFEPELGIKSTVVPGWITDDDESTFHVNPNTERAHLLDNVARKRERANKYVTSTDPDKDWYELNAPTVEPTKPVSEDTD